MKDVIPLICAVLAVLAILAALWYREDAKRANELYANSRANNELLINRVRKIYNDKIETDRRNAELETAAAEDKAYFDWSADIANSAVIKRLQAN